MHKVASFAIAFLAPMVAAGAACGQPAPEDFPLAPTDTSIPIATPTLDARLDDLAGMITRLDELLKRLETLPTSTSPSTTALRAAPAPAGRPTGVTSKPSAATSTAPTAAPTPASALTYPGWERAEMDLEPSSLNSSGGTVTASISTQDKGSPPVERPTFTITGPDRTVKSLVATSCGVETRGDHVSRCWETSFNVDANLAGTPFEYRVEAFSSNIDGVRAGSVTVSQYPRWEQAQVGFTPASLASVGGTASASISTQDAGEQPIEALTFTIARPDGTAESFEATSCGVEDRGEHVSRCWETSFNVEANRSGGPDEYLVEVSSSEIVGVRAGSVRLAADVV